jgi:hypothetical protein
MPNAELLPLLPMLFEDALDCYDEQLATRICDMYWENNGDCDTDALFEFVLRCAKADNVRITDEETCDYDRLLYNVWRCTEKGIG